MGNKHVSLESEIRGLNWRKQREKLINRSECITRGEVESCSGPVTESVTEKIAWRSRWHMFGVKEWIWG